MESLSLAYTQGEGNRFPVLEGMSVKETVDIHKTAQFTVWPQLFMFFLYTKYTHSFPRPPGYLATRASV